MTTWSGFLSFLNYLWQLLNVDLKLNNYELESGLVRSSAGAENHLNASFHALQCASHPATLFLHMKKVTFFRGTIAAIFLVFVPAL